MFHLLTLVNILTNKN